MTTFEQMLARGRRAEDCVSQWLMWTRGYALLPVYLIEEQEKGPRLYTKDKKLIVPDILAVRREQKKTSDIRWLEVKAKSHFAWYRLGGGRWQTGINRKHYQHYLEVQRVTGIPVFLLFLHQNDIPSLSDRILGSPLICPIGLFCCHINVTPIQTGSFRRGTYSADTEMVYWSHAQLTPLASIDEVSTLVK